MLKVHVGLLVFVSPCFLSLCLARRFCLKLLLANQKDLVFTVVLCLQSLICSSPPPPTVAFNFLTLKVNGIRDPIKRAGLLQWLSHLSCDLVCPQETHVTSWFCSSGFLNVTAPVTAHFGGQVLLYNPSFFFVNSRVEFEGHFLMAEFSRRDSMFRIASVYAPNQNPERNKFFTSCLDFAAPSVPTILCGDFNAVFDRGRHHQGCLCP